MKKIGQKVIRKLRRFRKDENGDLGAAGWVIGSLVLVVVIIIALKAIAPDTATNLWNTIWQWVTDQFGIN